MKYKRHSPPREQSKRDRALEFAMHIKKPKIRMPEIKLAIGYELSKEKDKLWETDFDEKKYRLEKEKIKLIYNQ